MSETALSAGGWNRQLAVVDDGVARTMDEMPLSAFHRRAVFWSGMGFFTDAYDLFIIGTALILIQGLWHLDSTQVSAVGSSTLLGAFVGAAGFGRLADKVGRRPVYVVVAALMIGGALASAFSDGFLWLIAARFVLGVGIGGDYPVSAVLASEYSNRADRGRMVGLVFSMQGVGLVVGPLVGLALVGSGISHDLAWRLMLGLGALPPAAVVYLRTKMPESPRFTEQVRGRSADAAADLARITGNRPAAAHQSNGSSPSGSSTRGDAQVLRLPTRRLLGNPRMLMLLVGTAGAWFLLDYAYYGNTISTPLIMKEVAPHASLVGRLAWTLLLFVVFAAPGYALAVARMDRIGHRRLQVVGFAAMAASLGALGLWPGATSQLAPFLALYGISYFFTEFGPNTTTFVLPSEVFPGAVRATGHGISAGVGKLGAFIGVFLFPVLNSSFGLRGSLLVAAVAALAGLGVTFVLPEPARRSLEEISGEVAAA